jgi:D-tyrosyl-tRNA(Tyr) deacylase
MRAVIQRVTYADVSIVNKVYNSINLGLLIFLGIENEDTQVDAEWLANKIINLRIFSDDNQQMNLSLINVNGDIMIISQFTLFASSRKGNRPSFIKAAKPELAVPLYEYFIQFIENQLNKKIKTGVFGADMKINLVNDGPVTIIIDSKIKE